MKENIEKAKIQLGEISRYINDLKAIGNYERYGAVQINTTVVLKEISSQIDIIYKTLSQIEIKENE